MTVQVRLFAILRERAGSDRVEVDLPEPATVADALRALAQLPGLAAVARGGVRMAVNREYAAPGTYLAAGDELALIPPVSGGDPGLAKSTLSRDGLTAAITSGRLDHEPELQRVLDAGAGAVVTFSGYPRDIPALEYEAYGEMAVEAIFRVLREVRNRHGLIEASAIHRLGPVKAFEASIVVAVSAPHREAAFAGAREILDRIKSEAPIWKVEVDADADADAARRRVPGTVPDLNASAG